MRIACFCYGFREVWRRPVWPSRNQFQREQNKKANLKRGHFPMNGILTVGWISVIGPSVQEATHNSSFDPPRSELGALRGTPESMFKPDPYTMG